jgi:hypothetical protein
MSMVDDTTSSGNLLVDGDFSAGVYTDNGNAATPDGWEYANIYGASFGGVDDLSCPVAVHGTATSCWFDGAVQAYDAIDQFVATTVGQSYTISFWLTDDGGLTTFSDLSTNGDTTDTGGNGVDALVYAQAGLPSLPTVPEPNGISMLALGLLGIGALAFYRRKQVA